MIFDYSYNNLEWTSESNIDVLVNGNGIECPKSNLSAIRRCDTLMRIGLNMLLLKVYTKQHTRARALRLR